MVTVLSSVAKENMRGKSLVQALTARNWQGDWNASRSDSGTQADAGCKAGFSWKFRIFKVREGRGWEEVKPWLPKTYSWAEAPERLKTRHFDWESNQQVALSTRSRTPLFSLTWLRFQQRNRKLEANKKNKCPFLLSSGFRVSDTCQWLYPYCREICPCVAQSLDPGDRVDHRRQTQRWRMAANGT